MAKTGIKDYLPYLDDVLALWTELGTDFKVGSLTRADVLELRTNLAAVLEKLNHLQAQMRRGIDDRETRTDTVDTFAIKFRSAVIAQYGPRSPEARRVPKLITPRGKKATPPPTPA